MTLRELAIKYSCDKLYAHSYIEFYSQLFHGRDVKRLLEIGIGYKELMEPFVPFYVHGASLLMWAAFWPEAKIFAIDIDPSTLINSCRTIYTAVCDQSKPVRLWEFLVWSGGQFDIVIDDGSHELKHQIISAAVLLPHVNKGGLYIVEDVREPEALTEAIGGKIVKFNKRSDDTLVVLFK